MKGLQRTTYTMWSLFRNCREACKWRYIEGLEPIERAHALYFGSLIHECLEIWHRDHNLAAALDHIDRACPDRVREEGQLKDWHLATAMMKAYAAHYPAEEFEVVALEKKFEGKIINPATGAMSRSFSLAGKVDGIVQIGTDHFLLEHKTASAVDGDYLERLWTDFQITLYSHYVEQALGIRIMGVIYNILIKARIRQNMGETEAEFEERRAKLIAKSKSGKSSAKRKMPESDEEFQTRLAEKYADPAMFHREQLFISRDRFEMLQAELWELTQSFLGARRRGVFYQNTSYCFQYNRPCAYFPLCRSNGNPNLIENLYQKSPPHQELRDNAVGEETPAF